MTLAISSGLPSRLKGVRLTISSPRVAMFLAIIGVSIEPGETAFALILGPSSLASVRVNARIAPLVAP